MARAAMRYEAARVLDFHCARDGLHMHYITGQRWIFHFSSTLPSGAAAYTAAFS